MTPEELETMRHSASHVLAQAVLALFPGTKLGIGPAVADGFYYDFDCPHHFVPEDLPRIEEKMREIVEARQPFTRAERTKDEAREFLKHAGENLKIELHEDLKDDKVEETGSSFKDGLLASLSSWGPSAGLGLLALLALGLVWSVVKKIQPVAAPPETVTVASENMTEGLTLDSILEGVELEADTIRASKMQEQIASMVKEDPESVANLVKRWIVQE